MAFDKQAIKSQVAEVLQHSQDLQNTTLHIDKLIDKWLEAKCDIIEAMNGELIYEVPEPVTFHLNENERKTKINDFVDKVASVYGNKKLAWFLNLNTQGFFDNITVNEFITPEGHKIAKGMKLVKAFKFFESDDETLKRLQSDASMIIQEDKIEGILCFSVHPLDFLSSSENTYNWRSCHALDGEYRSGNLSYMLDSSTIVCYLKGRQALEYIPRFPDNVPWNSKKWRMLIFLSESWQSIFAGRQYPFTSEGGLEIITPHLHKALKQDASHWSAWHNDLIKHYDYENGRDNDCTWKTVVIAQKYYSLDNLIKDGKNSRHFNDLLRSSYYTPFYSWNKYTYRTTDEHFTIGAEAPCIVCGEEPIAESDAMFCYSCSLEYGECDEEKMECERCGRMVWGDDMSETQDGSWICSACVENECVICHDCSMLVFDDEATWYKKISDYLCRNCLEDREGDSKE